MEALNLRSWAQLRHTLLQGGQVGRQANETQCLNMFLKLLLIDKRAHLPMMSD